MDRLPERQRAVILLHDVEEVPVREIAGRLGVPVFTVYTRLRRARQACARMLARWRALVPARPTVVAVGALLAGLAIALFALHPSAARTSGLPPPRLDAGIIGYWRFDERPSSLAAADLSGNGNDCR